MSELVKPTKVIIEHWDYHDIIDYIEQKYNIKTRDYAGRFDYKRHWAGDYPTTFWAKKHGYDHTVLNGNFPMDSEEMRLRIKINEEYRKAPDGEAAEPEYQDFWHLYRDQIAGNGSYLWIGFEPLDEEYNPNNKYSYPEWAKEILKLIKDEFSPDGEDMKCWIEW